MSTSVIQDPDSARSLVRVLAEAASFALDCEAAGFHRYSDRLCLVQVTVGTQTFVVDPLAFDAADVLRGPVEDPAVRVMMHGADYDLRLLDRDLGIRVRGLFDTQVAASLLGEPVLGLSPLLERHLGVRLSKKHQRADWAKRPLPEDMIDYAAADTRHLSALVEILEEALTVAGRKAWAEEEFRLLEAIRWEEEVPEDPVLRVKGARRMSPREVHALREALGWRDEIAQRRDRAPFRVAGDQVLVAVAQERPRTVSGLQRIKGMPRGVAKAEGGRLVALMRAVEEIPLTALEGYPTPERSGSGRPTPEEEERAAALKAVRNRRAEELGLARGALISNAMLLEIARLAPRTEAGLRTVPGMKEWQLEAVGDALLGVLDGRHS